MMSLKTRIARLEARLQSLIEGKSSSLFSASKVQDDLFSRTLSAMRAGARADQEGNLLAPNIYILVVAPEFERVYQQDHLLLEELSRVIREAGTQAGLQFTSPPIIKVLADPAIATGQVEVLTDFSPSEITATSTLLTSIKEEMKSIPSNAFLIVGGKQAFSLEQVVINIGRRVDNHLVIDDARVSRLHAQLRAIKNRYVIFDLDSKGGTFVNDERVKERALYPGDVISLAGFPLVYGQDAEYLAFNASGGTRPFPVIPDND
jgi:hypothetical protein